MCRMLSAFSSTISVLRRWMEPVSRVRHPWVPVLSSAQFYASVLATNGHKSVQLCHDIASRTVLASRGISAAHSRVSRSPIGPLHPQRIGEHSLPGPSRCMSISTTVPILRIQFPPSTERSGSVLLIFSMRQSQSRDPETARVVLEDRRCGRQ